MHCSEYIVLYLVTACNVTLSHVLSTYGYIRTGKSVQRRN